MKTIKTETKTAVEKLCQAAKKYGVNVTRINDDRYLYIFSLNGQKFFVLDHVPDLNPYVASKMVDDKALTKGVLKRSGFEIPEGFIESNLKKALSLVRSGFLKYPLVVKPVNGSQGQAVTVDIKDETWLVKGIEEVYKFNRRTIGKPNSFIVESYVAGDDYRFLVLDGKVLTVLMRKPAYVIGDGKASIVTLIDQYNAQPGIGKYRPLCPIVRDAEMARHLKAQGLSEASILSKGKRVYLRKNANISTGGRSFECTAKVHPAYLKLAVQISKLFGLRFCAVDLIAPNIRKFNKYYIIEVNNTPGFDLHEAPYSGQPFPVAEHLIKSMFKNQGARRSAYSDPRSNLKVIQAMANITKAQAANNPSSN